MATASTPFTLVCAVDLGEISRVVVDHAIAEALRHPVVRLHFVTVVPPEGRLQSRGSTNEAIEEHGSALRKLVCEELTNFNLDSSAGGDRAVRLHTRTGEVVEEIVELAYESRADAVVLGRYATPNRHRRSPGSVASKVLELAPCTVLVVHTPDYEVPSEDFNQCADCVAVRADSGGERWFCPAHSDGREPRLSEHVGISSLAPGWGLF